MPWFPHEHSKYCLVFPWTAQNTFSSLLWAGLYDRLSVLRQSIPVTAWGPIWSRPGPPPSLPSSQRLAPIILISLTVGFMKALPGPSGMGWLMRSRVGGGVVVCSGRGGTVAVRHASGVWLTLRWGSMTGSPGGMGVRVGLNRALLVGWRFVIELVVLVVVETVPLHILWRAGGPVRMPGRTVVGRGRVAVGGYWRFRARWRKPTWCGGRESVLLAWRGGAYGFTDHGRIGDMRPGRSWGLGQLTPAAAGCAGPGGWGDWTPAYWTTALHENGTRQIKQNDKINHTTRRKTVGDDA